MKTCLNRLTGTCQNGCMRDYNINHHPNNYDCANYREINIIEFEVVEKEKPVRKFLGRLILDSFNPDSPTGELFKKLM